MFSKYLVFAFFLAAYLLAACTPQQDRKSREFIAEGMKSRKIKRVTDAQLLVTIDQLGQKNTNELTEVFLAKTDASKPFVCNAQDYVADKKFPYVLALRLVCQENQALFDKEKQLLQAYLHNEANGIESMANIQKIDDSAIIYTTPVTLNGKFLGMWTMVFDKKQLIMNSK
jgi:hypothetical protein